MKLSHKITMGICGMLYFAICGAAIYQDYHPNIRIVEVEVKALVLDRIANCESSNRQYGKDGQVLVNINSNGSYDIGRYQINSVWNQQATKLGFNLFKEEDNRAFALWLFKTHGTTAWESSRKCWNN